MSFRFRYSRWSMVLLLVVGTAVLSKQVGLVSYPHWFVYPPHSMVVGYDGGMGNGAYEDGVERYYGLQKVMAKGVTHWYMKGSWIDSWRDSVYLEYDSPKAKDSLYSQAFFYHRSAKVLLLSRDSVGVDTSLVDMERLRQPSWVSVLPYSTNRLYGRGVQRYEYPFVQAWWASSENAILDVARQQEVKIMQLSTTRTNGFSVLAEVVRREEIEVLLYDVRVEQRWFDVDNRTCFTLVSAARK